jgi:hypothetical protein
MFKINQEPVIKRENSSNKLLNNKHLIFIGIILISIGVSQCLGLVEFHSKEKELLQRYKNKEPLTELEKFELCEWLSENKSYEKEFKEICESKLDTTVKGGAEYDKEFIQFINKNNKYLLTNKEIKKLYKNLSPMVKKRNKYERSFVYKTSLDLWFQLNKEVPNGFIYSTMSNDYKIKISIDDFLHIVLRHQVFENYLNFTLNKKETQFETEDQKFYLKDVLWSIETIFRSLTPQSLYRFVSRLNINSRPTTYQLIICYLNTTKEEEFYNIHFSIQTDTLYIKTFHRNKNYTEKILLDSGNIKEQLSKFQPNYFIYIKP